MANVNSPYGLKPIGTTAGGDPRLNVFCQYTLSTALAATLDQYTPVVLTGTGTNITTGGGSSEFPVGSFMGVKYIDTAGIPRFKHNWVSGTVTFANKPIYALVADDPNTLFSIQGNSESWVEADIGLNVDYAIGTRNATVNQSGAVAVRTGINTTSTLILRLVELDRTVTANAYGAYARLIVKINAHRYATATGA